MENAAHILETQLNNVNRACVEKLKECADFIFEGQMYHRKIVDKMDIIHNLLGTKPNRVKRGLLNIIGTGLKTLFGTMDNNDAEYYEKAIITTKENQEFIQNGLKEEVKVMKSLNEQNLLLAQIYQELENKTSENLNNLNFLIKNINEDKKKQTIIQYLRSIQITLISKIFDLELELGNLIDSILFLQMKMIHPSIIKPAKFIDILKSSQNVNNLIYYPDIANYHYLISETDVKAYEKEGIMKVVISVPIVERTEIDTFEIFNIPFQMNSQWAILSKNEKDKILLISKNKEFYSLKEDMKDCKEINVNDEKLFLCKGLLLDSTMKNDDCPLNAFMKRSNKNCNLKYIPNHLELIYKLSELDYLYAVSGPTGYKCRCKDKNYEGKIEDIGIIQLESDCKFNTVDKEIITNKNITEKRSNNNVYHFGLEDCCLNVKLENVIPIPEIDKIKLNHIERLEDLAIELNNQESYLQRSMANIPTPVKHTVMGVIGTLIIILLSYILCKCVRGGNTFNLFHKCFNKKRNNPACRNVVYLAPNIEESASLRQRPLRQYHDDDGYLP